MLVGRIGWTLSRILQGRVGFVPIGFVKRLLFAFHRVAALGKLASMNKQPPRWARALSCRPQVLTSPGTVNRNGIEPGRRRRAKIGVVGALLLFLVCIGARAEAVAANAQSTPAAPTNQAADPALLLKYPFFPFCIDWHDAKKRTFQEQAVMLKELGYGGVGHIWLDKVDERLKTLDEAGLKLYQITMTVDLSPDKPPFDPRFKEVLALVKGRHVQFDLLINGAKPSDETVDPRGVEILREMSRLAQESGSQLLLYPHVGCWVERVEDATRVAAKVDRPNVGVMFNLCHWLRVDKQRDYRPLLLKAMPRLWAVSINGADEFDDQPGWDHYIQPLDKGSFDVGRLLRTLKELGYQGPIGLQCYGIGGDAREHLARSIQAWRKLSDNLRN
jgi:sugar phosphate isomerase/epimerase